MNLHTGLGLTDAELAALMGLDRTVRYDGPEPGAIEGWRAWRLRVWQERVRGPNPYGSPILLGSLYHRALWLPGERLAAFGFMPDDPMNRAGIYACRSRRETIRRLRHDTRQNSLALEDQAIVIVGRVKLWGEVVDHRHGYRAQFAKPLAFTDIFNVLPPFGFYHLFRLRRLYGV